MPARVTLNAFGYQTFGTALASVVFISPDSKIAEHDGQAWLAKQKALLAGKAFFRCWFGLSARVSVWVTVTTTNEGATGGLSTSALYLLRGTQPEFLSVTRHSALHARAPRSGIALHRASQFDRQNGLIAKTAPSGHQPGKSCSHTTALPDGPSVRPFNSSLLLVLAGLSLSVAGCEFAYLFV